MFGNPFMPEPQATAKPRKKYAPRKRVEQKKHARKLRHVGSVHRGLVRVKSKSGKTALVAAKSAPQFQAFINALEAKGYKIGFMGGHRDGVCQWPRNKHPCGDALDINQTARGVVTRRFPAGTTALANKFGLTSGAEWRDDDTGHFEIRRFAAVPSTPRFPIARIIPLPPVKPAVSNVMASADPAQLISEPPYEEPAQNEHYGEVVAALRVEEISLPLVAQRPEPITPPDREGIFARYVASKEIVFKPWVVSVCPDDKPLPARLTLMLKNAYEHFKAKVIVNSAYRSKEYNQSLRDRGFRPAKSSQHIKCRAVDFRVAGVEPIVLWNWARKQVGITGLGFYGRKGHLHADVRPAKKQVVWGISKKRYAKRPGKRHKVAVG